MNPNNIALVGKMYSGKTTLANMLVERYGYTRMPLAEPVKEVAAAMCNTALEVMESPHAELPVSVSEIERNKDVFRPLLQWVGTEFFRKYVGRDSIWVYHLFERMASVDTPIVVDDVRFFNEARALSGRGFTIVKLIRTGEFNADQLPGRSMGVSEHSSETQLDTIEPDIIFECADIDGLSAAADELALRGTE